MSDKSKFEQMLEKLVADDRTAAEEIFHDIVVEKSRSIYEGLLEDDIKDIEVEETSKEDTKDSKEEETTEASKEDKKEDEKVEEKTSEESKEDEAVEEASKDESKEEETKEEESKDEEATDESLLDVEQTAVAPVEAGGDATDDMVGDIEAPAGDMDNGDDSEKGEEEIEDRVVDLEDAIDDLKAEFEKMMGGEDKGDDAEDNGDDAEDNGEEKEDEAVVDQSAEGETVEVAPELGEQPAVETAEPKTASEEIREYVNKVGVTHTDGSDSTKSPVAGKNDMGGSTSNIAKGGEEKGSSTPASKEENAGNVNVPGAKVKQTAAPKAKTKPEDDKSAKSTIGS